jgi:hypothetical protein
VPYKTKAEQEREEWMTLAEATAHIRAAHECDERAARRQSIAALANRVRYLQHLKWKRERNDRVPLSGYSRVTIPVDTPPLGRAWLEAKIRWKTGRVRDDWGEFNPGKWRVLLISRYGVARLWPLPADAVEVEAPGIKAPKVEAPEAPKLGAPHPVRETLRLSTKLASLTFNNKTSAIPLAMRTRSGPPAWVSGVRECERSAPNFYQRKREKVAAQKGRQNPAKNNLAAKLPS